MALRGRSRSGETDLVEKLLDFRDDVRGSRSQISVADSAFQDAAVRDRRHRQPGYLVEGLRRPERRLQLLARLGQKLLSPLEAFAHADVAQHHRVDDVVALLNL